MPLTPRVLCLLAALVSAAPGARAENEVSFRNKPLTMIISASAGGGTDMSGRLLAQHLARYLPDAAPFIIRNIPGAEGITSLNYFSRLVAPDGLTIFVGTSTLSDPLVYRRPQSQSTPLALEMFGGLGRGGKGLFINRQSEPRLYDKRLAPVVMGSFVGVPRSGMQMAAWGIEFLDWNARWVVGYHGDWTMSRNFPEPTNFS